MKSFRKIVGEKVEFGISPYSLCPCGSGAFVISCCQTPSGLMKHPKRTSPPPPVTGFSHPGCYAGPLGDCSKKLSREHFVTETLLEELNRNGGLHVSGLSWEEADKKMALSPKALASKILCERHNSALSPVDAIAVNLFTAFHQEGTVASGHQLLHLFSGHDLERWLLKILCGIVYSGNLSVSDGTKVSFPINWLQILFGQMDFPEGCGLYVCRLLGKQNDWTFGLKIGVIFNSAGLSGVGVWVCANELILSMSGFPSRMFDGRPVVYRPLELYITGQEFEKSILFSWQGPADLGTLSIWQP
jgi:hypothetical protein